jgi:hypothetical protein
MFSSQSLQNLRTIAQNPILRHYVQTIEYRSARLDPNLDERRFMEEVARVHPEDYDFSEASEEE